MQDKTTTKISDDLRQYLEAMVEEVVLEGKSFEIHKKYLPRFCQAKGIDYNTLETHLIDFFETALEMKVQESKGTERLLRILAPDCLLSDEEIGKLTTCINKKRNENNLYNNFFNCLDSATKHIQMRQPNDGRATSWFSASPTHHLTGMKILMFGWEYPPQLYGELASANQAISNGLQTHGGVNITLCLPKSLGGENSSAFKNVGMCAVPIAYRDVDYDYVKSRVGKFMVPNYYFKLRDHIYADFNYMHLNDLGCVEFAGGYPNNLLEEINNYSVVAGVVARTEEFDIIQANDWPTYPAGIHAKNVSGKPLSIYVHATDWGRNHGNVNATIYSIEKDGMDNADYIMCVSELTRQIVINHYHQHPQKCFTVHHLY